MKKATTTNAIPCKICNQGALQPRKTYRLGTPMAVIGYILMVPSLGILFFSIIGIMIGTGTGIDTLTQAEADYRTQLHKAGLSAQQIADAFDGLLDPETLSSFKQAALEDAQLTLDDARTAAIVTGGSVVIGSAMFLPAGFFALIGWVFCMRKRILQCSYCKVVQPAG